jgi:demethylspheroidene O-methyltransferase
MHELDFNGGADNARATGTFSDQWKSKLDRWMTNPSLYRFAISNPITRWFAQRRTQKIFDLMAGFVHSQVLLSCTRLKLFSILRQSPMGMDELALKCNIEPAAFQRLIFAAVALKLLEFRSGQRIGLGPLGVPLATHDGILAMVEHNHLLYQDLLDPVAFLNNAWDGSMAAYWPYAHASGQDITRRAADDKVTRYSALMAASQNFVIQEILSAYDFSEHRSILDVGTGLGRFISELALKEQHLKLQLFDLPPVLNLAKETLAQKSLTSRAQFHPGSFVDDALPTGSDLITLVRVAHDHPDSVVRQLLQKAHDALPPGGVLLIAEPMASEPGDEALGDAYFHYYLLAMGAGRLRTPTELSLLLAQAGFRHIELVPNAMPIHARLLIGRKTQCLPLFESK